MQPDGQRQSLDTLTRDRSRGEARPRADYASYFLLLATAGFFLARLPLLAWRRFDPDEFQHAHDAWSVFREMLPYRDFFEHHTPWYYYALAPFFRWFSVDVSFESARQFLLFGRGLSLLLTIASVALVIHLGRLWQDRRVGLVAGFLAVSQPVICHKTLEMRPDVLALPFFLGALCLLLRGLKASTGATGGKPLRLFLAGGFALGAAIMCTQKMLFVLPGLLAGLGVWALLAGHVRRRVLLVALFLGGVLLPGLITWAAFALQDGGGPFITNNFLLNAGWRPVVNQQLLRVLETSWPVLLLTLLGASVAMYWFFRRAPRDFGGLMLLCTLLGLVTGILVVPVAHRQYYLMPLPIACLFAAKGLVFFVDRARQRARPWLLALAMLPLAVLPVLDLRDAFEMRNDEQFARLRYVLETTRPTDMVMDGWQGTGVFRPHAFHYFFLHEESLVMLPREPVDAFLDDLESGKVRPRLIAMDENLVALGSRFVRFVRANYETADGFFYRRRGEP